MVEIVLLGLRRDRSVRAKAPRGSPPPSAKPSPPPPAPTPSSAIANGSRGTVPDERQQIFKPRTVGPPGPLKPVLTQTRPSNPLAAVADRAGTASDARNW